MKYYAGIGSRTTPQDILMTMTIVAESLKDKWGYTLRSGGATGADSAFAKGAGSNSIILRPKHATAEAVEMASKYHPAWHNCNDYVRKLHGRNAQIILGPKLDEPSSFVLCWTPKGNKVGGTALGIRIAEAYNIPVFNFALKDSLNNFIKEFLDGDVGQFQRA